jgi:hypothetical protein
VKLASMSIKPQLPFKSDSLNKLWNPILELLKKKDINGLYSYTTDQFQSKFSINTFESALSNHFDQYEFLNNFTLISQSVGVSHTDVILTAEYKFEYKKEHFRNLLLMFKPENDELKLINVDFSMMDK